MAIWYSICLAQVWVREEETKEMSERMLEMRIILGSSRTTG